MPTGITPGFYAMVSASKYFMPRGDLVFGAVAFGVIWPAMVLEKTMEASITRVVFPFRLYASILEGTWNPWVFNGTFLT